MGRHDAQDLPLSCYDDEEDSKTSTIDVYPPSSHEESMGNFSAPDFSSSMDSSSKEWDSKCEIGEDTVQQYNNSCSEFSKDNMVVLYEASLTEGVIEKKPNSVISLN
jgi:hypothetical protein